jgi:hypothetical protein
MHLTGWLFANFRLLMETPGYHNYIVAQRVECRLPPTHYYDVPRIRLRPLLSSGPNDCVLLWADLLVYLVQSSRFVPEVAEIVMMIAL